MKKNHSANLVMNQLSAVIRPMTYYIFLLEIGCRMSSIAQIYSEFASMSRLVIMNSKNLPK